MGGGGGRLVDDCRECVEEKEMAEVGGVLEEG
jgi:hypothetical protein